MNEQILTEEMLKFIEESPTAFHAAANVEKLLQEEGFVRIEELVHKGYSRAAVITRCRTVLL